MTENFSLPVDLERLQNERIKLVPLETNIHPWSEIWLSSVHTHPEMYKWLLYGPFTSASDFVHWYDTTIRTDKSILMLAIIVKAGTTIPKRCLINDSSDNPTTTTITTTDPDGLTTLQRDTFAGLSAIQTHPGPHSHLTADMGQLLLPQFHRTFVGTHANGLLLHHLLDQASRGGLGLRRIQWQANASNEASVNCAKRLGFKLEGIVRWQQVLPWEKVGPLRGQGEEVGFDGERVGRPGRHTALLGLCWDDWEEGGGRELVDGLMRR